MRTRLRRDDADCGAGASQALARGSLAPKCRAAEQEERWWCWASSRRVPVFEEVVAEYARRANVLQPHVFVGASDGADAYGLKSIRL
jgi:hypothetical protein